MYCLANKCDCIDKYRRNECGVCVPEEKCNKKCQLFQPIRCDAKNEELIPCFSKELARTCKNRCKLNNRPTNSTSPEFCILNVCDCRKGFWRNKCGQCVPDEDCDKKCKRCDDDVCSDPNEIRYSEWRQCEAKTCKSLKKSPDCSCDNEIQRNICDCKPGYYRNECNLCIPKARCALKTKCKCTNPCPGLNQSYECFNNCSKRTCQNYHTLPFTKCVLDCTYGCQCKSPLWSNEETGECVTSDQCPPPGEKN